MPIAYLQENETNQRVIFFCPGCKCGHHVQVKLKGPFQGPLWSWNGSLEKPTFSPSILVTYGEADPPDDRNKCHSFVNEGMIQFLTDCSHSLAGKTVPLENF